MRRFVSRVAMVAATVLVTAGVVAWAVSGGTWDAGRVTGSTVKRKLIVTKSPDSLAPKGAPAHWLPPEDWIYNHWLPYDETRLYSLLGITRLDLWNQLRDDRHTVAQLAAQHGWPDARRLATALVAPQAGDTGGARARVLRGRALRTITQGHLAQHIFFHSLHQFAIPSEAPELFGVSDADFRALRRAELSPLMVARLHGRSLGEAEALAIAVLRERVSAGVEAGFMPVAQGRRLLRRQLTQLPRWLGQARYNGPPPTTRGALLAVPRDYASNPAISADGRHVAYESYRQKLPLAVRFGEIAVMRADLPKSKSTLVSPLRDGGPVSNYNPAISADGQRIVYETSAGNDNFAKRYGRISLLLTDLRQRRTIAASSQRPEGADSQSDYNPVLAANGRREAFQAIRGGRTAIVVRDLSSGRERIAARGAPVGGRRFADVFEPELSADGTRVAFTVVSGRVDRPHATRTEVRVNDLRKRRPAAVDGGSLRWAGAGRSADDPAISADGRWVVFTSYTARPDGAPDGARLLLHDLATGRTLALRTAGPVLDPVVARDARTVAYTTMRAGHARVQAWSRATRKTTLVSRASGDAGVAANGDSSDPSISGDGRRIAFTSTATNLAPGKTDDTRAIFVRDLRRASTDVVSDPSAAYPRAALSRVLAAAKAGGPPAPATITVPDRPEVRPGMVAITDNAFFAGTDRPTLRVDVGQRVTWSWQSRQSHSVTVRSGPERFASPVRNDNTFTHRFRHAGTYELVCSLHAPGMRMTVEVR